MAGLFDEAKKAMEKASAAASGMKEGAIAAAGTAADRATCASQMIMNGVHRMFSDHARG